MFGKDPFCEYASNWIIVWVGNLNADELDEYLSEYRKDYNDPMSRFAYDLGTWYDHDFIWRESVNELTTVRVLCERNGVEPPKLVDEIVVRSRNRVATCLLVLWNARRVTSKERTFAEGKLHCIGCWEQESPLTDPDD